MTSDDLLGTVKAELSRREPLLYLEHYIITDWLRALLARCEAAEGCDGNCSCVVMSRHEWQRAYSEERLKHEAAEAERDALRTMNDPEGGEKQTLIARLVKAESELAAARAEVARLREARADDVARPRVLYERPITRRFRVVKPKRRTRAA